MSLLLQETVGYATGFTHTIALERSSKSSSSLKSSVDNEYVTVINNHVHFIVLSVPDDTLLHSLNCLLMHFSKLCWWFPAVLLQASLQEG